MMRRVRETHIRTQRRRTCPAGRAQHEANSIAQVARGERNRNCRRRVKPLSSGSVWSVDFYSWQCLWLSFFLI
ncbi:hypothetical protein GN956_G3742 [Arapaima gigas]